VAHTRNRHRNRSCSRTATATVPANWIITLAGGLVLHFHPIPFRRISADSPKHTYTHPLEQWRIRWQFSLKFRTAAKVRLACFKRLHQWQIPLLAGSGKSKVASAVINVKSALPSVLASSSTRKDIYKLILKCFLSTHMAAVALTRVVNGSGKYLHTHVRGNQMAGSMLGPHYEQTKICAVN